MSRPSEPLLAWLRVRMQEKGLNTASVAAQVGMDRARARKILAGTDAMTVDELLSLSQALEVAPGDFGLVDFTQEPESVTGPQLAVADGNTVHEEPQLVIDTWGNQVEQLFRTGFALGCDFLFVADVAQLDGSGVPKHVLEQYRGKDLPIRLDALYHRHQNARYDEQALTVDIGFDALYTCRFPWASVRQVIFWPMAPEADLPQEKPRGGFLRLVD